MAKVDERSHPSAGLEPGPLPRVLGRRPAGQEGGLESGEGGAVYRGGASHRRESRDSGSVVSPTPPEPPIRSTHPAIDGRASTENQTVHPIFQPSGSWNRD